MERAAGGQSQDRNSPNRATGLSTMVRAIRKELHWSKAELARRAKVSDRTITNMDEGFLISENTCSSILDAVNRGLRRQRGQLNFLVTELTESDLFELIHGDRAQRARALPAPKDMESRRRAVKAFMEEKAKNPRTA